jgi:hypothetical protein
MLHVDASLTWLQIDLAIFWFSKLDKLALQPSSLPMRSGSDPNEIAMVLQLCWATRPWWMSGFSRKKDILELKVLRQRPASFFHVIASES